MATHSTMPGESPWTEDPGRATVHVVTELDMTKQLTHVYPSVCTFFLMFFSIVVYPRRLNTVPCALQ